MVVRGIISPPRSRSSPRERRPYNSNNTAINNPPSKPTSKKPNNNNPYTDEPQRSDRKESKPTTIPPTKNNNNGNRSSNNTSSRIQPSKSTSRPKTTTPNPNHKKLDNNSTNKISTRSPSSSKPSSPGTAKPISQQSSPGTAKSISQQSSPGTAKSISQQTRRAPSKSNVKGGTANIGSGSRSELSSAAKPRAIGKDKYFDSPNGSSNPYSAGQYATLRDLHVRDQLQKFSIDGKDLASIVLHAESMGSDTKKESSSESNDSRMFQIYKEIASHRQENSSITSYFTKLKALWDELATFNTDLPQCSCGGATEKLSEYMEREKVMQFLVGLDASYTKICNQTLLTTPFPTVEKAYYAIIREEKRRELLVALETVAEKVMQNNWLDLQNQNAHSNNGDSNDDVQELVDHSNNLHEQQFDQNQVITSFPIEPLLIDLGSPVRC